jgi:hypothetical protein
VSPGACSPSGAAPRVSHNHAERCWPVMEINVLQHRQPAHSLAGLGLLAPYRHKQIAVDRAPEELSMQRRG